MTTEFISKNILLIQGHLRGQKVNSKVKTAKIGLLTNSSKCNSLPLYGVFLTEESICGTILMTKGHLQGQNVNVKVS